MGVVRDTKVDGERPTRWMAVGHATGTDTRRAGREAAGRALSGGADPRLLIVFCARTHDMRALAHEIRECSGGVPLIGCTTSGEISGAGPGEDGVVVTAIGGSGFEVRTAAVPGARDRQREAGAELARLLNPHTSPHTCPHTGSTGSTGSTGNTIMMLLTDGMNSSQQQIIRGIYGVLGAGIPLVGGAAGDGLLLEQTLQVCDDEVFDDAIVAAMIVSTGPIGLGINHGWRRMGEAMLVTAAAGNRIDTIDDKPALDVYLGHSGAPLECHADEAAFLRFSVTHPFGFARRQGEAIRSPSRPDYDGRGLFTLDEVPQGRLLWLMEGDADSMLNAGDRACEQAIEGLGGQPPIGLLVFDCVARKAVLGDDGTRREVERMERIAGGVPLGGFYTYGEIARTQGVNGLHNQTLVALALG